MVHKSSFVLKNKWCTCGASDNEIPMGDNECSCGIARHHYHCSKCGGTSQVG